MTDPASPGERAEALRLSAQAHRDAGNLEAAIRDQDEAVTLYRELGDPRALAHAIRHLADMVVGIGLPERASPLYREMIGLYRKVSDPPPLEIANAFRSLAVHRERLGQHAQALELWTDVRDRYRELDATIRSMAGGAGNPALAEAEARIARLKRSGAAD